MYFVPVPPGMLEGYNMFNFTSSQLESNLPTYEDLNFGGLAAEYSGLNACVLSKFIC